MPRMGRVIHTGQALVDVTVTVPSLPERGGNVMAQTYERYAGGSCNILIAAARSGAAAVAAGSIGTGPNGDLIRSALAGEGVDVSSPPVSGQDTGICFVMVEPSAERSFVTTLEAERRISVASLASSSPVAGDIVCLTGYSLAVETTRDPLLQWISTVGDGVEVVLDPGAAFAALPRDIIDATLQATTVWTGNAQEARHLARALGIARPTHYPDSARPEMATLADLVATGLPRESVVIVRDGDQGCAVREGGRTTVVKGFPQKAVDTNGAGDAHTGALTARRALGEDWMAACRYANAAAGIKVTRVGPASAPGTQEILSFLTAQAEVAASVDTQN